VSGDQKQLGKEGEVGFNILDAWAVEKEQKPSSKGETLVVVPSGKKEKNEERTWLKKEGTGDTG